MNTRLRIYPALAVMAAVGMTSMRGRAQAIPSPTPPIVTPSSASSAASSTAITPPGLAIVAPAPTAVDAAPSLVLAPVRANVSLTTNALLGFVNSQPVFAQDMFRPIDQDLRDIARTARNITEFRDAARQKIESQMRAYVYEMVMFSSAKAALSDEDKARLDVYIRMHRSELLSKYGGSLALADQALRANGSSVDKEMEDFRRTTIVGLYMHKQLFPRIVMTRQMVMDQYDRSTAKKQDAEIELFTITLPLTRWLREPEVGGRKGPVMQNPTGAQILQAEQMAMATGREIAAKARACKSPEEFAALAEDYSSADQRANYGGYWPSVKHDGSLNPKIENYAFSLPANTVGEPLLLANSDFHSSAVVVLKVGKKKEARIIPFSEAQASIRDALRDKQYKQLQNEYIDKLTQGAAIEAVDHMTDVALEVAVTRYATQ